MGRQVCFRAVSLEERDRLMAYASHTGDGAYFIPGRFPGETPPLLESIGEEIFGCIVRQSDVPRLLVDDVPSQGYWYVDSLRSPVVEWGPARLWFATGYWDANENWVIPDEDWLRWANGLLRWVRTHFTRDQRTGCYEGTARA